VNRLISLLLSFGKDSGCIFFPLRTWQICSITFVYDILFPKVSACDGNIHVVKCLFKQALEGVEYLHKNEIIDRFRRRGHNLTIRDLKISNLLLNSRGILKIGKDLCNPD